MFIKGMYVCLCVWVPGVHVLLRARRGHCSPGAGITGSWEPPDLGRGN